MALQFVRFDERHISAAKAFNRRMADGHVATDFFLPTVLSKSRFMSNDPIQWTQYVVLDGDQVRGGVLAMEQPGWANGKAVRAVNFQSPLSEGLLNSKYSVVALQMVKFMQRQAEAVFLVGMGSADRPLPRLLAASGWLVRPIPFFFRVHHAGNFLRELQIFQTSPVKRLAAHWARLTGLGAAGLTVMQRRQSRENGSIRQVSAWGDWADDIWQRCRDYCSFAVQRDRRTLENLYPTSDLGMKILLIERMGTPVGWSVYLDATLTRHRHFGNLRLGSILDCLADPDAMVSTAMLTDREIASQGCDLVIVNHSYAAWAQAFRSAGFLAGPSNYLLASSKRLSELVRSEHHGEDRMHVTRGDGDGRIHLA